MEKGLEGRDCDLIWGTIPPFVCWDWGKHEQPQSEYPVCRPIFAPGNLRHKVRMLLNSPKLTVEAYGTFTPQREIQLTHEFIW